MKETEKDLEELMQILLKVKPNSNCVQTLVVLAEISIKLQTLYTRAYNKGYKEGFETAMKKLEL